MEDHIYVQFMIGHLVIGVQFSIWGLWHLFNIIKLHSSNPKSYVSLPWFPISRFRYLELYITNLLFSIFILHPLITPLKHDSNQFFPILEHAVVGLSFWSYGFFAILLDKLSLPTSYDLTTFLFAVAFGQELLVFYLHSTDHVGIEGQYHWLVQIAVFVSFATALLAIKCPKSFLNGFVRSVSILLQGVWFIVMGLMIWTPSLVPDGCFLILEGEHWTVRCHEQETLRRAKSMINIRFGFCVIGVIGFALAIYFTMIKLHYYEKIIKYQLASTKSEEDDEGAIVGKISLIAQIHNSELDTSSRI